MKLHVFSPVSVLPDLNKDNGAVKTIKYKKRQCNARNDAPREETEELELKLLGHPVVWHERVEQPHGHVGKQQERDDLTPWFKQHLIARSADAAAGFGDKHSLHRRLNQKQTVADENHGVVPLA